MKDSGVPEHKLQKWGNWPTKPIPCARGLSVPQSIHKVAVPSTSNPRSKLSALLQKEKQT